jgi:large subunit ribosomal protein L22
VAKVIGKVVKSAVANAVAIEGKINVEELRVTRAVAGAGPTMKRFLPRAQGRATPILKRTCHITIVVEGHVLEPAHAPRRARRTGKAPETVAAPAAETAAKPERAARAEAKTPKAAKPRAEKAAKPAKAAKAAKPAPKAKGRATKKKED